MSKVFVTMNGFVGFGGQSVWLGEGDEYDDTHPLVKAHPEHFTVKTPPSAAVAEDKAVKRRNGGRS